MKKQTPALLATAAALGALAMTSAAPASADLVTRCVGEGGAVTVPGDLVVPADQSCTLTGTTVTGDVRVAAGADLILDDVTIDGRVVAAENAYFEAAGSSVEGDVILNGAYGTYLETSEFGNRLVTRPNANTDAGGFIYAVEADVEGNLISNAGEVFSEDSAIGGTLNSNGSVYTDLFSTFVDGRLIVRDNEFGAVICGSVVEGDSRFLNNGDLVQIGSDGPFSECDAGSYFGDNVIANGNTGGVQVDNAIINGNLTLRNNDPVAQVGEGLMIRGDILGDYNEGDGAATTMMRQSFSAQGNAEKRAEILEKKIEKRHAAAVKSADAAGTANIGR